MAIMAFLPKSMWRLCRSCGGSGDREQARDLHRSGGIVPCGCQGGYERYDAVEIDEYNRRARAGELATYDGVLISPHRSRWDKEV